MPAEGGFDEIEMVSAIRVFTDFRDKGIVNPDDFYTDKSSARKALSLGSFMVGGHSIRSAQSPDDLRQSSATAESNLLKLIGIIDKQQGA